MINLLFPGTTSQLMARIAMRDILVDAAKIEDRHPSKCNKTQCLLTAT